MGGRGRWAVSALVWTSSLSSPVPQSLMKGLSSIVCKARLLKVNTYLGREEGRAGQATTWKTNIDAYQSVSQIVRQCVKETVKS